MCDAKPAPRCSGDSFRDLGKATKSAELAAAKLAIATAAREAAALTVEQERVVHGLTYEKTGAAATPAQERLERLVHAERTARETLTKKQRIEARRDHQFELAVIPSETISRRKLDDALAGRIELKPEDRARHEEIVRRADAQHANPSRREALRREHTILRAAGDYTNARRKYNATVENAWKTDNLRLRAAALDTLDGLPEEDGGRPLTAEERQYLADIRTQLADVPDYLPAEETPEETRKRVITGVGGTRPGEDVRPPAPRVVETSAARRARVLDGAGLERNTEGASKVTPEPTRNPEPQLAPPKVYGFTPKPTPAVTPMSAPAKQNVAPTKRSAIGAINRILGRK